MTSIKDLQARIKFLEDRIKWIEDLEINYIDRHMYNGTVKELIEEQEE